jgi:hypothetical protein
VADGRELQLLGQIRALRLTMDVLIEALPGYQKAAIFRRLNEAANILDQRNADFLPENGKELSKIMHNEIRAIQKFAGG